MAVSDPDDRAAQQFYLIGGASQQGGAAAGPAVAAVGQAGPEPQMPQISLSAEARPEQTGVHGNFVLDAADALAASLPASGATFPADEPPTVGDTQILIALKDGSLFLFDKDLLSGHPHELRDALGDAGIVIGDPAQGSDVLEEFGLTNLLGGWLSELQGLAPGDAGDLAPHNGFF
jgi:hypothetical protein